MATVNLCPTFGVGYQAFDANGVPLNGGLLWTYAAGSSTPTATYTTSTGNVQNSNPIQLGSDGRPPSEIWLIQGQGYKLELMTSASAPIATYDNIKGINDPGSFTITGAGDIAITTASGLPTLGVGFSGTLLASQNGTQLTVAVKTAAGNDPSATDPVGIVFRSSTQSAFGYTQVTLTAANTIQTTVGGTFGIANNVPFRLWIVAFNDGGTVRLGLINCLRTVAGAGTGRDAQIIFPLGMFPVASSTQIGAGSTLDTTFYTAGAAVTSKVYAILGYLTYESGLATAGTFNANQTTAHLQRPSDPLPNQQIAVARMETGAVATGTTVLPLDNSIPLIGEGDQYMAQAVTPNSCANVLLIKALGFFAFSAQSSISSALFQDLTSNALAAAPVRTTNVDSIGISTIEHQILAGTQSATTFKFRAGPNAGATMTFNGESTARLMGGVANSFIDVKELLA